MSENRNNVVNKTNINWFPGHMVKAKKEIQENLKLVDVVIEIVAARIPMSSRNPDFEVLVANKPRVIGLNKFDLADSKINKLWVEYYNKLGSVTLQMLETSQELLGRSSGLELIWE